MFVISRRSKILWTYHLIEIRVNWAIIRRDGRLHKMKSIIYLNNINISFFCKIHKFRYYELLDIEKKTKIKVKREKRNILVNYNFF